MVNTIFIEISVNIMVAAIFICGKEQENNSNIMLIRAPPRDRASNRCHKVEWRKSTY